MSRSVRRFAAVTGAGLALTACAHVPPPAPTPPVARPAPALEAPASPVRIVRVPMVVKCVPDDLGAPPAYPDSDQALRDAGGAADRYQLLAAGRLLRESRLKKLEEIVRRCRTEGR